MHERDERECDGAPERDCAAGGVGVGGAGFAGIDGLCLAESDELVQGRPKCAAEFPGEGGEGEREGKETEAGDEDGRGKRGPGGADARIGEVKWTRSTAGLKSVHDEAKSKPSRGRAFIGFHNRESDETLKFAQIMD